MNRTERFRTGPICQLMLLAVASIASAASPSPAEPPVLQPTSIRLLTWNIHHGEGTDRRLDLERIAKVIREARPDLVALQEVDQGVQRTQRRDLPAELAALTGLQAVFSNNFSFQGGRYGNAILSRLPILSATNRHYAMLQTNEQRGLLEVTVSTGSPPRPLRFLCTHLDYRRDDTERLQNVREIRQVIAAQAEWPTILAGDFNDLPDSRVHRALKLFLDDAWESKSPSAGSGHTYPAGDPNRRIDYLFLSPRNGWKVTRTEVITERIASDHRPIVAQLELPHARE